MLNISITSSTKEQLEQLCYKIIDNSQDFTDSIYTNNEEREQLLEYHKKLRDQLSEIIKLITNNNDIKLALKKDSILRLSIESIQQLLCYFRRQVNKCFSS